MAAEHPTLTPAETARLIEFARACKAAARAVQLYPAGHPAIAVTLGRIANVTSAESLKAPLTLTVHPDGLLLDDRAPVKPDTAINELAALLHGHVIGQMTVHPGGDVEAWRTFLLMLGRTPESVRAEGGITRAWAALEGRHVELREIDYAEVLREKSSGLPAAWDKLIAHCLQGAALHLDDDAIAELLGVAADPEKLNELMAAMDAAMETGAGIPARTAALMRLMRGIIEAVSSRDPEQRENTLRNLATSVGQLSPEMLMGLFDQRGDGDEDPQLVNEVVSHMSDGSVAGFVSRNVRSAIESNTAIDRVVQAFQTLVPDEEQRPRLLALAKEEVDASPLGSTEGFESVWSHIAEKLLTSYSDESYVSQTYGRELSGARTQALEVEQVSDDPQDRLDAWRDSIDPRAQRALDLLLVLDLLRIEADDDRWGELLDPVKKLIDDLLLVGDFDAASQLIEVIVREKTAAGSTVRNQQAVNAVDSLIAGSMMRHVATHLATLDDGQFGRVKAMCVSLGDVLVRPLAETLSIEERPRTRERLTAILLAFGASGRRTVEKLKHSTNPAVRRTAIHLLREFGGSEALPELTELLGDNEPQVQREAVRAILNIGTDQAFDILQRALTTGSERSRDAIVQSISSVRDERAAPLFAYVLRTVDHRGPLASLYLRAIESLGALKDAKAVEALKESLYRGEWWAPRRTNAIRTAAATALARIGTPEAIAALDEAAASGGRGVRAAVRPQLDRLKRHGRERTSP
ncbi:MAG TPA: HEAT repeat domain-containing protein [Vicinamibacterales bacterium]